MPLYEYECPSCHHRFEKIESYSAPEKRKCPQCGKMAGRVLTAPAIQFKGSGWYVTDYGGKGAGTAGKSNGTSSSTSESGSAKSGSEKTSAEKTVTTPKP